MEETKEKPGKRTFSASQDDDEEGGSDSDLVDVETTQNPPKKRRRKQVINKYLSYCKKYCIPYPEVGAREKEHFDLCHVCQELWPLYLFRYEYTQKLPMEDIAKNWCQNTEKERAVLLKELRKEHTAWMKNMTRSRVPSGYQLFLREKRLENADLKALKFGDCTSLIAKLWATFTPEQKKVYNERSEALKVQKKKEVAELPAYKKKLYDREKRKIKAKSKSARPKKPSNSFMLYLNDRWSVEKEKNPELKYRDIMNAASKEWDSLPEVQKFEYRAKFMKSKEIYLQEKEIMKNKEKEKAKVKVSL